MKNNYFIALFFSIILFSCSKEGDDPIENNSENFNELENSETLQIEETTYLFEDSKIFKMEDGKRKYSFKVENSGEYNGKLISQKGESDQILIENPNTDEFILLRNIVQEDKNTIIFEFRTSNSKDFKTAKYTGEGNIIDQSQKCPVCVIIVIEVVDAIIEFNSDDYDSNCKAAIDSCGDDGPSEIKLEEGGWFSAGTCSVKC